jgi:hypothetical protein
LPDEYEDTVRMSDRLSRGLSDAQVYLNDIIGADPSRPWDKYSIDLGGTTRRMPQAKPIKWDEGIDSEYAAASQRVGKIVHEEFTQRLQQNRESARAKVEKDVESLLAVVSKSMSEKFGYEFVATPKNVEMSLYNGKVSLTVYPDGRGITSTSYDFDTTTIPREIFVEFVGSGLRSADPDFEVRRALKGMVQRTFMEVMEEIRPMGGAFAGVPKHRKTVGGMSANEQLTAIAKLYPSDWIDASNILGEVSYRLSSGRQHYDQHKKEVTLDKGDLSTGVHEVGHRMEDSVPGLAAMERLFFERRTFGEVKIPLRKLQPKSKYRNNEYSKPDKFFHPYAGKEYSDGFYEIFTMGMEEVAMGAGRNVGGKGTIDDDYSSFMFGVLATLYREPM